MSTGYELDLWAWLQAKISGAELDSQASREDINSLLLSLSGQISETWVEPLSQRQKQQELELNKRFLELIEMRFTMSLASALDVYQQGQTVNALKGGLIITHARQQLQLNQPALLTGRSLNGSNRVVHASAD